MQACTTAS